MLFHKVLIPGFKSSVVIELYIKNRSHKANFKTLAIPRLSVDSSQNEPLKY
jgi:hypothetical protein